MESLDCGEFLAGTYARGAELEADVELLVSSLTGHHAEAVVESFVRNWVYRIRAFGLHTARLDIRQESSAYALVGERSCVPPVSATTTPGSTRRDGSRF